MVKIKINLDIISEITFDNGLVKRWVAYFLNVSKWVSFWLKRSLVLKNAGFLQKKRRQMCLSYAVWKINSHISRWICQVNRIHPNVPISIERMVDKLFSMLFFKSKHSESSRRSRNGNSRRRYIFFHNAFKWK